MSQIQKWPEIISRSDATATRAEGAQADVWSALHSPDHPPFFVFLSFSCFYIYCGSMCSMGSMWAQQSYSAVLHLHLWWYYFYQGWFVIVVLFLYCLNQPKDQQELCQIEDASCHHQRGSPSRRSVSGQQISTEKKQIEQPHWRFLDCPCNLASLGLVVCPTQICVEARPRRNAPLPHPLWWSCWCVLLCAAATTYWPHASEPGVARSHHCNGVRGAHQWEGSGGEVCAV